jgi:lysozyme
MIDQALPVALALMRRFEGFYSRPYLCPAGVPTIGYGSTYYENGVHVTLTDEPVSKDRAEALLLWAVRTVYLPQVIRLCPGLNNADKLAAIIDFTYNLGGSNLKVSTLRRKINEQKWEEAKTELLKWVRGGGKVLKGLVIRRTAESELL